MDSFQKQLEEVTPKTALRRDLLVLDPQETPAVLTQQSRSLRSRGKQRDKEILKRLDQGKTKKSKEEQQKTYEAVEISLSMLESDISNIRGLDQTYADVSISDESSLSELNLQAVTKFHRKKDKPRRGFSQMSETKLAHVGRRRSSILPEKKDVSVLKDQTYGNITYIEDTSENDSLNQEVLEKLKKLRSKHRKALSKTDLTTKEWVESGKRLKSKKGIEEALSSYKNVRRGRSIVVAEDTYGDLSNADTSSDSISVGKVKVFAGKKGQRQRKAISNQVDLATLANPEIEAADISVQNMPSNMSLIHKKLGASSTRKASDSVKPNIESSPDSLKGNLSNASTYSSPVKDQNENNTGKLSDVSHRRGSDRECEESYTSSTLENSLGSIQTPKKLKLSQKAPPIQLSFSSIWSKLKDKSVLETATEENTVDEQQKHEDGNEVAGSPTNIIGQPRLRDLHVVLQRLEETFNEQLPPYKNEKPVTPPKSFRDDDQPEAGDEVTSKGNESTSAGLYIPIFSSDSSDSEVSSNISAALGTLYEDYSYVLRRKSGISSSDVDGSFEKGASNTLKENVGRSLLRRSPQKSTHDLKELSTKMRLRSSPLKDASQESPMNTTFQKRSDQSPKKGNQQNRERVPIESVSPQQESNVIMKPSPVKRARNSFVGVSLQEKMSDSPKKEGQEKRSNDFPKETSPQKKMRVTPLKVNPQNEIHGPAKEISISPRKTSSQKKMSNSPQKVSPQKRMSVSPKKVSPQKRMSVSPKKVSPQKRMSVSPKKASPQKRMSVSPKKASPQKRMSVSPKKASPQKSMSVSPKKASPQKRMSVSPQKASPQKRLSVSPKKASPQKRMNVSPKKASPQKRMSVSPKKASHQKRMSVSSRKASPQQRMSVSPRKVSPQKRMSVSPRKVNPQNKLIVSPNKANSQKRISVSAKKATPQKRINVTPEKSSPKKKMSDFPKGTSSQMEFIESPLKGTPQNRKHDFLEAGSTHTASAKIASPQKRRKIHSQQEFSPVSDGSPPRKLRNSSREVRVLEKTEKSYASAVSGAKGDDESVLENGGFEMGVNLEMPSSDSTSTHKDTLESSEKTLVENAEESLERQGLLEEFTETPRKLNLSENISKNEGLEREGNPDNASLVQITSQEDTQASVEKTDVENSVESPGKPSLHKRYSGISMKLSMSESRSDTSQGIDEEISISSERRSSSRKRNSKKYFGTDDITSSVRDVSLKKSDKDNINISTSKKKSSEGIALKRKISDTSFVHGELFLGDKNEQGSGKRRRRNSLKRRRSSSREDERGLKSIVHEVLVHPEEAIKAMRKSNYLLGDKNANEDLGSEHAIELQEEDVGKARGSNTGTERTVKNNSSTVNNSVVTQKHVEDQRERSDKLNSVPQSDNSGAVIADTQEDNGETEGDTTSSDKYIEDTPVTRSVEVEGGKDQREENIDRETLEVEEETGKDTQSDNTVIGDVFLDGRSTKEGENKNQEKDAPVSPSATVQGEEQGIDDDDDDKLTDINEESYAASSDSKDQKSNSHVNDNVVPGVTVSGGLSSSVEAEGVRQVGNENEIDITSSQDDELSEFQVRKLAIDVEGGESSGDEELSMNLIPISFQRRNEKARIQKENITLTQQEEKVMSPERETSERSSAGSDPKQPSETPKLIQMTMTNFLTKLAANPPRQSALYDVKESKDFVEAMFRGIERPQANQTKRLNIKTKQARKEKLPLSVPESMTKEIFEHYAKCKVDKNALKTIVKISEKFWGNCAEDLMSIAKSRGERFVITKEDVIRLMTREGTISESTPLTSLIMEYLPSEEWDILIPTEYGHNRIYPPPEK